ncbi:hypothetical protein HQ447_10745 [bacterium]|nr:hypothetical protein [bacterium]
MIRLLLLAALACGLVFADEPAQSAADAALVRRLLAENLSDRTFSFATVAEACSGKRVLPLTADPAHLRVTAAISRALEATLAEFNRPDSPVRQLRRINEASRYFEDAIQIHLNATSGLQCGVPPNRAGGHQRSGYPDLRIVDLESGLVFYLDPKLVEHGSAESTFRSFYFEPKTETLKITDDAVHLLVGIEHDGKEPLWTFTGWRLLDLSTLRVRLKAEFQASNAELYQKTELSLPGSAR